MKRNFTRKTIAKEGARTPESQPSQHTHTHLCAHDASDNKSELSLTPFSTQTQAAIKYFTPPA
jgi:hypothetical protein